MKGYLSKRSFFGNGALQCRLSSRCFTPPLSLFLPETAVFLVARRSPAFSGKVIFLRIFTSLSASVAISKAWVNNYIVAAVGHTLFACNSCCKNSRMVLALAIITRNVTKIGMFAKMCRKITKGHEKGQNFLGTEIFFRSSFVHLLKELCRSGRGQSLRVKSRVDLQCRLAQKRNRESCRR